MSKRTERKWTQILHADGEARETARHTVEAASILRGPRAVIGAPKSFATKGATKRWMRAFAEDYEGPTQLVEGVNAALDIDQSLMDDGTSWLWEYASKIHGDDR